MSFKAWYRNITQLVITVTKKVVLTIIWAFVFQLGTKRIHTIRTRGGNKKYRALRLDTGNYAWGSEGMWL